MMSKYCFLKQLAKFGLVGIAQNLIVYCFFLILTAIGLEPKLAVFITYPTGVLISYLGNKNYTFRLYNGGRTVIIKYILSHISGLGINLCVLYVFHDVFGYPYEYIQLLSVIIVAVWLFYICRVYVFKV